MYDRLSRKFNFEDVHGWKKCLSKEMMSDSVKRLFLFWADIWNSTKTPTTDELIKYNELFSLLENVFRNALLRPYIPAYRTINMNCGRYRFSESDIGENLLSTLKFRENPKGMRTYEETDPQQTVVYALTCFVIWHFLSLRLRNRH